MHAQVTQAQVTHAEVTHERHPHQRPTAVVFDVNETLSDMAPMAARFADVGAPAHLAVSWFAMVLRDGFALTAAGGYQQFARLSNDTLRLLLHDAGLNRDLDAAVAHILDGFRALAVHPDVPDGIRALRDAGLRLVTLSNGAAEVAERLLSTAGIRAEFEAVLSVDDAGVWKPAAGAYQYAAAACGTALADMMLVAVHPWDLDGAARAGMSTAWVNRGGVPYPGSFTPPGLTVASMLGLATALSATPAPPAAPAAPAAPA